MRRWGAVIAVCVIGAAIAVGAFYCNAIQRPEYPRGGGDTATLLRDPYVTRQMDAVKLFDPVAHARAAIAKQDFRYVEIGETWRGTVTPGIQCISRLREPRRLFFSDVVARGEDELRDQLRAEAAAFNRTLVGDPAYPGKDICMVVEKKITSAELATHLKARERRPQASDLASAVRADDFAAVKRFIEQHSDVNLIDKWGSTPLIWAVVRGNREIFDILLRAGAEPNKFGGWFSSPLIAAVNLGDVTLIRALLDAGKTPTARNPNGWHNYTNTHLISAIEQGRPDIIKLLIEYDAVPSLLAIDSWEVPLSTAVRRGCTECIEVIFHLTGRALAETEAVGKLFLEGLTQRPTSDLMRRFARAAAAGLTCSENERAAFLGAMEANHVTTVRLLLEHGQNVNFLDRTQAKALVAAASSGDATGMMTLIKAAAARRSAIDDAIKSGNPSRLRTLLVGRDMLVQHNTITPLMLAATIGNAKVIDALISLGANPNEQVHASAWRSAAMREGTPLSFALEAKNLPALNALLRAGIDPNGIKPLLTTIAGVIDHESDRTKERIVDAFLSSAVPERRAAYANLMLYGASSSDLTGEHVAEILVARGADPCADIPGFNPALLQAASKGTFVTFLFLTKHCASWSPTSEMARNALQYALGSFPLLGEISAENTKIALFLIRQKTPLSPGGSDLCDALESENVELAEALIDAGANINDTSGDRTALDCATYTRSGNPSTMIERLRKHGAKTAAELGHRHEPPFPF